MQAMWPTLDANVQVISGGKISIGKHVPSLKLNPQPLKMDAWNTIRFLLGFGLLSGASFAVSFRVRVGSGEKTGSPNFTKPNLSGHNHIEYVRGLAVIPYSPQLVSWFFYQGRNPTSNQGWTTANLYSWGQVWDSSDIDKKFLPKVMVLLLMVQKSGKKQLI